MPSDPVVISSSAAWAECLRRSRNPLLVLVVDLLLEIVPGGVVTADAYQTDTGRLRYFVVPADVFPGPGVCRNRL